MPDTLVMDERIVWDSRSLKQIDEAKMQIMKYKRLGHQIFLANDKPMEKFSAGLEEVIVRVQRIQKCIMKILSDNGDDRIVWDKDNGKEAKEAKAKFVELLGKNYKAYSVDVSGKKHKRIEEFDVDAQEILMIPPTARG